MTLNPERDLCRRLSTYVWQKNPARFAFPPAREAQLCETEALLNLSLPPLLRALYTQIANGGFGPGGLLEERISGALGGFRHETKERLVQYNQALLEQDFAFVDMRDIEAQQGDSRVLLFNERVYPTQMFPLWNDSTYEICIHCQSSRIYLATDDFNALVLPAGEWWDGWAWFRLRDSLADWLVSWLQGETLADWMTEVETFLLGKKNDPSMF